MVIGKVHFRCKECNGEGCEPTRKAVTNALRDIGAETAWVDPGYGRNNCNDAEMLEVHTWRPDNTYIFKLIPNRS